MRLDLLRRVLCYLAIFAGFSACFQLDDTSTGELENVVQLGSICGSAPTCSITDELCQRTVLRITACIRGDETPELPSIRVITRDELRDERTEEKRDAADETSRKSIAMRNALAALRFVTPDSTLADAQLEQSVASTAAFYRIDMQDISIVSDVIEDPREAMTTLSHEFTH